MNKLVKISSILVLFFSCFHVSLAQTPLSVEEAAQIRQKVQQTARETTTITSDFVQKKHLDFLSNDIETFGNMLFKHPNWIRWEYTKPFPYSVIFKADKLYVNDEGKKNEINLGANELFQSLNDLIAKSIRGDLFDEEEFDISYFSIEEHYLVKFKPKRTELQPYIKQFQLFFDQKTAQVLEVKMIEPTDDYTRIIFKNRIVNNAIDDAMFSHE